MAKEVEFTIEDLEFMDHASFEPQVIIEGEQDELPKPQEPQIQPSEDLELDLI